jgi:hypothetical protein
MFTIFSEPQDYIKIIQSEKNTKKAIEYFHQKP